MPTYDFVLPMITDANGEASLPMPWPTGVAPSPSTWWQYWVFDATGPPGFTASNAVRSITPPI